MRNHSTTCCRHTFGRCTLVEVGKLFSSLSPIAIFNFRKTEESDKSDKKQKMTSFGTFVLFDGGADMCSTRSFVA